MRAVSRLPRPFVGGAGRRVLGVGLAAAAVCALGLTFKPVVEGDGIGYYSYLHSVWVDHDLDLGDEYAAAFAAHATVIPAFLTTRTGTGRLADFFPVGPAVLASPFYLAALAAHPAGRPLFGPPFTTAFTLASLFFGLLALAAAYRVACRVAGPAWAAFGTAGVALATPFPYYLALEPSYSHTFSALAVGVFLLAWLRSPGERGATGWFVLGLLGGLMGSVRFQDGPIAALALLDVPAARRRALWFLPGLVLGFAPQLVIDRALFGTWLPQRPAGQDLDPLGGHYVQVLLSAHSGLLVWSPVVVAALFGGLLVGGRRWRIAFAYALLVEIAINGAAPDWSGGFSFGARRFLDLTPFFAGGIALAASRVGPRAAAVALALLTAWNTVLVANLTYVQRGDRDPGYLGLLTGQARAVAFVPRLFVQGTAGRDLLWWPALHRSPDLVEGAALVLLMALFVAGAWRASGFAGPRLRR